MSPDNQKRCADQVTQHTKSVADLCRTGISALDSLCWDVPVLYSQDIRNCVDRARKHFEIIARELGHVEKLNNEILAGLEDSDSTEDSIETVVARVAAELKDQMATMEPGDRVVLTFRVPGGEEESTEDQEHSELQEILSRVLGVKLH